jgi:copper resistance protein C
MFGYSRRHCRTGVHPRARTDPPSTPTDQKVRITMTTASRSLLRACRAATATFLLAGLLAFFCAPVASAHAALVSSDPAADTTVPAPPPRVTATFNEPMQPAFAAMTVVGPDGGQWGDGEVAVTGADLAIAVRPGGPAGVYTVNYRATSADGHVVSGAWSFTAADAAPPTSSPAASTPTPAAVEGPVPAPQDTGTPVWPYALGVTLVVAGGALWAVRRRS